MINNNRKLSLFVPVGTVIVASSFPEFTRHFCLFTAMIVQKYYKRRKKMFHFHFHFALLPSCSLRCPVTDDVIIGDTSWRNESSRVMKLTYNAFAFAGQESSVYFQHCTYRVCSPDNNSVSALVREEHWRLCLQFLQLFAALTQV